MNDIIYSINSSPVCLMTKTFSPFALSLYLTHTDIFKSTCTCALQKTQTIIQNDFIIWRAREATPNSFTRNEQMTLLVILASVSPYLVIVKPDNMWCGYYKFITIVMEYFMCHEFLICQTSSDHLKLHSHFYTHAHTLILMMMP